MLIDSRKFSTGKIVRLASPLNTFRGAHNFLKFQFNFNANSADTGAKFRVILVDASGMEVKTLFEYSSSQRVITSPVEGWTSQVTLCIPEGNFKVIFEATAGDPMASDMAIDAIELVKDVTSNECELVQGIE